MLEIFLKLYVMAMALDVRSPTPHLVGPPGCGKSTMAQQLADLVGVNLHILNVARLSPLDVEGIQMPVDDNTRVHMIPASFWSSLQEGDIILLDEFLRGFPEVYNALLDILTSRRVGAFVLPKVFIMAASNTTIAYDKALEDRLLHLPVPDPRKSKQVKARLATLIVETLGLLPEMGTSMEMQSLLDTEVLPMYAVLDSLKNGSSSPAQVKGTSLRHLIGQAQLREIQSTYLDELISMNNRRAMAAGKPQYVLIANAKHAKAEPAYEAKAKALVGNSRLSAGQALTLNLNLQLIEMESIRYEKGAVDDHVTDDDEFFV